VVFFEDSYKNLVTAHKLGMATVMVKGYTAEEEGVSEVEEAILDAVVPSLSDLDGKLLRAKFPALFAPPC
jgi:beta-phosphoglucomutase-like phosphatase (HAD superfamily)